MPDRVMPPMARALGYAGLLPQLGLVCASLFYNETAFVQVLAIIGWAYAALIFSFLGGVWWGYALLADAAPRWTLALAVTPSLVAMLSLAPVALGASGLAYSLFVVGVGLIVSPRVDTMIAKKIALPIGWLQLRWHLSIGLGVMTIGLAVLNRVLLVTA